MPLPEVLAQLPELARTCQAEDLPSFRGLLAAADSVALSRLVTPAPNGNGHAAAAPEEPERWITPEEAAAFAGVPKERLYIWAKGQRWASRPSTRCLRINEKVFHRWLAARA